MTYSSIIYQGLWKSNANLVQLLGLCPLLAVTGTAINGLGLGIATLLTVLTSNFIISLTRNLIPQEVRLPIFVLIIASIVTAVEMFIKAYYYDLYLILGIFIPLIVTNCFVIGRAEAFASKHRVDYALLDGLMMGLGSTLVLVLLGGFRELVGYGTLFSQAELLFGAAAQNLTFIVIEDYRGFLLAILPPGAFIGLGLLVALKNWLDHKLAKTAQFSLSSQIEGHEQFS